MTITSMLSESVALSFTVTAASTATAPSATSGSQSCSTGSSDEDSAQISPRAQALSKHSSDTSTKADDILKTLDADDDGSVSKQEFSDNASQVMDDLSRAGRHGRHHGLTLDKLFSRLDTNSDGAIDRDELGAAVEKADGDTSASTGTEAPAASLSFSATLVVSFTAIAQYSKASEAATSPSSTGTQVNTAA